MCHEIIEKVSVEQCTEFKIILRLVLNKTHELLK